ncbi:hypothetical protein MNR01_09030 [Lysobacter sp. S4-A87]|uniref:hypothetical protein n=1 Tax=Lysobacter sp. S4-A87 TaxID=2925843 RepID=UPI001F53CD49|nr:hypothetical protein [Lysobacter sp. S4-A87]UNK47935.1 hypothetical protein MNR01_09030 [Lysobacter sp. S4-A87]
MTNYVCRYPDGAAGLGLLFVRTCHVPAAFAIAASAVAVDPHVRYPLAGLIALLLVLGLATRLAALSLGVAAAVAMAASSSIEPWLLVGHVGGCAGLMLLGAGAYSVDARLHGRRVIHLHATTPDRGADD